MNVNIYSEQPIIDIGKTMISWFGQPTSDVILDIGILFSFLFLFTACIFILCIFFKRR